jgi:class 3 adenylate cyclase
MARFCDQCGSALEPVASAAQSRKVVTVVFADLVGSTAVEERMDPESVRRWLDRVYDVLRTEVERHDGRVVKFLGDGVMAVFGVPHVREDDAARAVAAAVSMQDAVADLGRVEGHHIGLKVGVNTGEVVVTADDDDVVGDAVNVASRLEQAAGAGQVIVGESTFRLVRLGAQLRALPPLELKGKAEPVHAFQLVSLRRDDDAGVATPFVGRRGELDRLLGVLDAAIVERRARLASIVGSPGVGKTRLAHELSAAAADRARVVDVRCEQEIGATFAPIAKALRQAASLEEDADDESFVSALSGLFEVYVTVR